MQRVSTTVVAVVGTGARGAVERLAGATNVHAVVPDPERVPLDRAVDAWTEARHTHAPYFVHDADPLVAVEQSWVRRYDEARPAGELEVAVAETLARWRAGSLELPDYYVVLDADGLDATRRHWYLGVLHGRAPLRVVPARGPEDVAATLRHLSAAPWWPPLEDLLDGIDRVVPDRVGIPVGL